MSNIPANRAAPMRAPVSFAYESQSLTSFSNLGLAEPIVRALTEAQHVTPTPIQAEAIPQILAGRDLIGIAQTGTGKTAAFALPILDRLVRHPHRPEPKSVRALVLSPTRELSGQIVENFERFGRHANISVSLAIGGVPMGRQIRALSRGVDVLVATPGRLIDLVENNAVKLDQVEVLVLDEADQMLDMGFVHAIRAIVRRLPHKRHSLFFSATMPHAIAELAGSMLRDPVRVAVTPVAKTADRVEQRVILVDKANKGQLLAEVLSTEEIDHVINFDLPNVPESYVHRIGRTARAGREGIAISFCDHEERAFLRSIEKLIKMQLPASDRRGAGTRFAVPELEPIILDERDETSERSDYIGRSGRQNPRGQRPRHGDERSGEGRSRAPRSEEGRPQAARAHQPRGEGRPSGGRPEGRPDASGAQGAGHRAGQPARAEGRGQRTERGQRPAGDIGGLGFMQSVPNRGQRSDSRPGGAKRPVG